MNIMNKLIISFLLVVILVLLAFCFLPRAEQLPNYSFIGLTKSEVVEMLPFSLRHSDGKMYIIIKSSRGCYHYMRSRSDVLHDKYLMSQDIWDVNSLYGNNGLWGGYYFYRLHFNPNGKVDSEERIFMRDAL